MKARSRWRSVGYALVGIRRMLADEPNARLHLVASVAVVGLGLWLDVDRGGWAALVLAMALVWSVEATNTAIEYLADALHPELHPGVGTAKDVAAGAVLLAAGGAAVVGLIVLGPPLWERLMG